MTQDALNDYTKELFTSLGWEYRETKWKGIVVQIYLVNDNHARLDLEQATQIAKEVKRREIEARIDELRKLTEWKISETNDDDYDILHAHHKRVFDSRITNLEQQLNALKEDKS